MLINKYLYKLNNFILFLEIIINSLNFKSYQTKCLFLLKVFILI